MMKMQEETKAVYEKYGVSQMGGCVQMLIQMPILLALYQVLIALISGLITALSLVSFCCLILSGSKQSLTIIVNNTIATATFPMCKKLKASNKRLNI